MLWITFGFVGCHRSWGCGDTCWIWTKYLIDDFVPLKYDEINGTGDICLVNPTPQVWINTDNVQQPCTILFLRPSLQICQRPGWETLSIIQAWITWSTFSLQWRHNGRDGVSHPRCIDCLLNCYFGRRSKKTSQLRVTVRGIPRTKASNAENHVADDFFDCIFSMEIIWHFD